MSGGGLLLRCGVRMCDVSGCQNEAVALVRFPDRSKRYPYCRHHLYAEVTRCAGCNERIAPYYWSPCPCGDVGRVQAPEVPWLLCDVQPL